MPSYRNTSSDAKIVDGILFKLNTITTTTKIISDSDLERTDYEPYWNPIVANHEVTSVGAEEIVVDIDYENTKIISIWNDTTERIRVFINSISNDPPMYVHPNSERSLEVFREIERLIVSFPAVATIYIEERKQ